MNSSVQHDTSNYQNATHFPLTYIIYITPFEYDVLDVHSRHLYWPKSSLSCFLESACLSQIGQEFPDRKFYFYDFEFKIKSCRFSVCENTYCWKYIEYP